MELTSRCFCSDGLVMSLDNMAGAMQSVPCFKLFKSTLIKKTVGYRYFLVNFPNNFFRSTFPPTTSLVASTRFMPSVVSL